jgi:hypothetical protein
MIIYVNAWPCCEMSMQGIRNLRHWPMHRMDLGRVSQVSKVTIQMTPLQQPMLGQTS